MVSGSARRELIVSRTWIQATILVMLFGLGVMGMLAYGANAEAPPVPMRVVDPSGAALFTAADIVAGQKIFLRNGLMEYGSIFGHGAYLGVDYTADALRRGALDVLDQYGGPASHQARARTIADDRTNTYQASTATLAFSAAQVHAYQIPSRSVSPARLSGGQPGRRRRSGQARGTRIPTTGCPSRW